MKQIKKILSLVCVGALALSMLTACNNPTPTETSVTTTEDDNQIRLRLVEAINTTKANESFVVTASHTYTMNMANSMNGISIPTVLRSNFSGTYKYNKTVGDLFVNENNYTVTATDSTGAHQETQESRNSYVEVFKADTKTFYFSQTGDNSQMYSASFDFNSMVDEIVTALVATSGDYTILESANQTTITQSIADATKDENFQAVREKWHDMLMSVTEYSSMMTIISDGLITYTIDNKTGNITCIEIKNVNITDSQAKGLFSGNDSLIVGNITMTASMKWVFSEFNTVTEDDIMVYRDQMNNAIEHTDKPSPTPTPEVDQTIISSDGSFDQVGVANYELKEDLPASSFNAFQYNSEDYTFPVALNTFIDSGWNFTDYNEADGCFYFTNEAYPYVKLALVGNEGDTEIDELAISGVSGISVICTEAIKNGGSSFPGITVTNANIHVGDTAVHVLETFGKPDMTTIGAEYDTYTYAVYDTEGVTGEIHIVAQFYVTIHHINGQHLVETYGVQYLKTVVQNTEPTGTEPSSTTDATAETTTSETTQTSGN